MKNTLPDILFLGIDPGLDGAIAAIDTKRRFQVLDTATIDIADTRRRRKRYYNVPETVSRLRQLLQGHDPTHVCAVLELVRAMPKQGVRSMFGMGQGLGMWEGILASHDISYIEVAPRTWQTQIMRGIGKGKHASRLMAQRLFPKASLARVKDHNRADALLMAEYASRYWQSTLIPTERRPHLAAPKKKPRARRPLRRTLKHS